MNSLILCLAQNSWKKLGFHFENHDDFLYEAEWNFEEVRTKPKLWSDIGNDNFFGLKFFASLPPPPLIKKLPKYAQGTTSINPSVPGTLLHETASILELQITQSRADWRNFGTDKGTRQHRHQLELDTKREKRIVSAPIDLIKLWLIYITIIFKLDDVSLSKQHLTINSW